VATYGSAEGARALVPSVTALGEATTPTLGQVNQWLAQGYSVINRYLAAAGYTIPVVSSAAVYAELSGLNNLYAAAHILRALGIDLTSGDREERSAEWLEDFHTRLKELVAGDLTGVGVTQVTKTTTRRRRIRTLQLRRIDGYSGTHEGAVQTYPYPSE
jgi:hypothetical protein